MGLGSVTLNFVILILFICIIAICGRIKVKLEKTVYKWLKPRIVIID